MLTQLDIGPFEVNCPTAISRNTNGMPITISAKKYGIKKAPFTIQSND